MRYAVTDLSTNETNIMESGEFYNKFSSYLQIPIMSLVNVVMATVECNNTVYKIVKLGD